MAASALLVASGRCNSQFVSICVAATERRRGLDSRGASLVAAPVYTTQFRY